MKIFGLIRILFVFVGFILFSSCQDDDICVESLSPRLTIVFLDSLGEKQMLDSIFVDVVDLSNNRIRINTIDSANVDSLQLNIPIQSTAVKYIFYRSTTTGITDEIQLTYTPKMVFVSKACGFAYNFYQTSYTTTNNLITSITQNTDAIENEQETNLFIIY